jgi:hypothetical protein
MLPVLREIRLFPNGNPFPDGVVVAYAFTTVYHNYAEILEKMREADPHHTSGWSIKMNGAGHIHPDEILPHKIYWAKQLDLLYPMILNQHMRRKYALGLCGIVKETWWGIPFALLSKMGAFEQHRLYDKELDIDSYRTNCDRCNKPIRNYTLHGIHSVRT